ncbi:Predicted pyridoxine biosynthesis protein (probably from glycolaldehide) [Caballeronia glathei]|uniref:Type III effector n=1 Tax=Caballeronia glathei TaxID=60547 RepID=A0A069PGL7_9BURK|nr:3-oxo-isoapionate kinase OiaK [Caballeronia glathei]KDR39710.1 type III effector [Caballeronia glathei]CDY74779.1 Predicted pyridoxine biosynthesis protein (probably from glycolaldehide) [Caballeronia glathei]
MNAPASQNWPAGLLLAYYGDDFTGSTDAMEAMTAAGVPTLLCLETPTPELLARFPGVRCVGLAGSSRGRSPQWMDDALPQAFASLAALGAPVLQYKVCSTFDSSPETGSIGRAIDIGVKHMPAGWSPMIVGAPRLKRYQAFGNLFAAVDGEGFRLDRHPTMSRHPVTPMNEADLRVHLRRQTDRRIELIDLVRLRGPDAAATCRALAGGDTPVVMIDVLDEETLAAAGRLVWEQRGEGLFSASSSGLQYALAAHWRACGLLPESPGLPVARPVDAIAAVSGSCSPVTAQQIRWARSNGFRVERLDLRRALGERTGGAEIERVVGVVHDALRQGRSALVHSAEGPDDPDVLGFDAIASAAGLTRQDAARRVGGALAEVMRQLLDRVELPRVVVAGGDSSGEVAGALGISALSVAGGLAPGAPLCRAWSALARRDGLEIVLKGGQIGDASFFGAVREGRLLA